ncbi:MAG: hypothetical protein WD004_06915 [Actinomycetota bacterium]
MNEPFGPVTFVADPRIADARSAEAKAEALLDDHRLTYRRTDGDGAGGRGVGDIVANAVSGGARFLAIVGDDRSFSEAVDAALTIPDTDAVPTLGMISTDPESDLIKTFGLPAEPEKAARHLVGGNHYPLDIGRITCSGPEAGEVTRHFALVAMIGSTADMLRREARLPRSLGDRGRRFVAFWSALARAPMAGLHIRADRKEWEGRGYEVIVGNCNFFRGLRVSPRSYPGDGVLDVLVWNGPRSDQFTLMSKMVRGEHVPSPHLAELRAKIGVGIESDRPLPVSVDGQVIGTTPAKVVVMPAAVNLKL